jgi:PPOX class probable F420-dependent enzyme
VPVLNEHARAAIEAGNLAHLVTINPDGSPQVTVIWVGLDGDDIVFAHLGTGQKLQNLRRDPRVTVSLLTGGKTEGGLDHYLVVRGTASLEAGGGPELLQRLAHVYIGPDVKFPAMDDPPAGHVVRITPERVIGVGPWTSYDGP